MTLMDHAFWPIVQSQSSEIPLISFIQDSFLQDSVWSPVLLMLVVLVEGRFWDSLSLYFS